MLSIIDLDVERGEFQVQPDGSEPRLTVVVIDTDGQSHQLAFEERALMKLARFVRALPVDDLVTRGDH
jgi:hypothetical protein